MAKKKLGMGLSALLGTDDSDNDASTSGTGTKTIAIGHLHPGKYQPRQAFDEEDLQGLSESIRTKGVLQPLLVRPHPNQMGAYEIIAGERRWRAAQMAKIHEVPVIIKDFDDRETLEVALIENLQRQDLSPLEEADGFQRLMNEFSHTQEALAAVLGKSRSHVANMLRLLTLPSAVKDLLNEGRLSVGHARALVGCENATVLADIIVKKGLNVRQTEQFVKDPSDAPSKTVSTSTSKQKKHIKDADTLALEQDLANVLGLRVDIQDRGGKGQLIISYENLEQLDGILARLNQGVSV